MNPEIQAPVEPMLPIPHLASAYPVLALLTRLLPKTVMFPIPRDNVRQ